ncbi:hypothetical protein MTR_2g460920 [Medicago truncatula]|uniref:Uncharacterized protein n=1 Tax=Medicago truncatula TaxID=3880 RepID=A0A072V9L5_MEDTR|nr:hypothetical protein MTR_2g460920 [Medicago truncatula]
MTLKLADRSTIQPAGYVEDIPVKIEWIYIPTDFMVVDIEEDRDCSMILGRPFLATAGAIVDVKNGRIVFQVSDEMVGFELENVMKEKMKDLGVFVNATYKKVSAKKRLKNVQSSNHLIAGSRVRSSSGPMVHLEGEDHPEELVQEPANNGFKRCYRFWLCP